MFAAALDHCAQNDAGNEKEPHVAINTAAASAVNTSMASPHADISVVPFSVHSVFAFASVVPAHCPAPSSTSSGNVNELFTIVNASHSTVEPSISSSGATFSFLPPSVSVLSASSNQSDASSATNSIQSSSPQPPIAPLPLSVLSPPLLPPPNASLAGSTSQQIISNPLSVAALAHCAQDDAGDEKEELDGKSDTEPSAPAPTGTKTLTRNQRKRANKKAKQQQQQQQQQQALSQMAAVAIAGNAPALPPLAPGTASALKQYLTRATSEPPPIALLLAFYQYDIARISAQFHDSSVLPFGAQVHIAAFLFIADAMRNRFDQHLSRDGVLLRYSERAELRLSSTYIVIEKQVSTALLSGTTDVDAWWSLPFTDFYVHKFLQGSCCHWRLSDSPSAGMGFGVHHFWRRPPSLCAETPAPPVEQPRAATPPPKCCSGDMAGEVVVIFDPDCSADDELDAWDAYRDDYEE